MPPEPAPRDYDRVSHGYAPEGRAEAPPPEPLDAIVRDVVVNLSATAQAEMALLEARGSLAWHAIKWTAGWGFRSEEHTSELQSPMRISYAVFCLKKKKLQTQTH